ncbi:MAG: ABC transporter ATP-binding protein [Verrucomicrobiota bacterium]
MPLLSVSDLRTHFHTRNGVVRAVDGVGFSVKRGEILGIVGESGSGKSVTCMSLLGLLPTPPARNEGGRALFDGKDLLRLPEVDLRAIRGKRIGMIFQDPMTALNPYLNIGEQLTEPLRIHFQTPRREARQRAADMLAAVGINEPDRRLRQYPHEFSGGMRQRVMIAMALITKPELLIADEPTTALDVTVQAQILDLIKSLQKELNLAVIFITHDLGVVSELCDRVIVMYAGRIAEEAPAAELFANPLHPYTRALQHSIPSLQAKGRALHTIRGLPPDLTRPLPGCAFAKRCEFAANACRTGDAPALADAGNGHRHACLRVHAGEIATEASAT